MAFVARFAFRNCLPVNLHTLSRRLTTKVEYLREDEANERKAEEKRLLTKFFETANKEIEERKNDRHFAIVHFYGQQHLVKEGDIIISKKWVPAEMGETIKFEKCLLVGNERLTLVGRPLIDRDLVHVEASVVSKTTTHTYCHMKWKQRSSGWRKWWFKRLPLTMLRINEIKICHKLNETQSQIQ